MAQAFFERDAPADVRAESAGTNPATEVWPEVVAAMAEIGIDLAGRRPRRQPLATVRRVGQDIADHVLDLLTDLLP